MTGKRRPVHELLRRPFRACVAFVGHLIFGLVVLCGVRGMQWVLHFFWSDGNQPVLFGVLPLQWCFDAADLGVLSVFAVWGTIEANRELSGSDDRIH